MTSYQNPYGGADYLGLRKGPRGVEIIYDDGVARRLIWRVREGVKMSAIGDALSHAIRQTRIVPALYAELRRRSIVIEAVTI